MSTAFLLTARRTAAFDLVYSSLMPQRLARVVQYSVNGHHPCSVAVRAESIATSVTLSRSFIEFHFPPDVLDPCVTEVLTLSVLAITLLEHNFCGAQCFHAGRWVLDIGHSRLESLLQHFLHAGFAAMQLGCQVSRIS